MGPIKEVLFFTNIFPFYRKSIYNELINSNDYNLKIFYDPNDLNGIKPFVNHNSILFQKKHGALKNYTFFKKIFWQSNVIKKCFFEKYDEVIFLGEMNILSTWISILIGIIRNKSIILWGHGLYGNENRIKLFLRLLFLKLANKHLVYEKRSKSLMIKNGICPKSIFVIYNSLDYNNQLLLFNDLEKGKIKKNWNFFKNNLPTIFFIGRLLPEKKIELLINSMEKLNLSKNKFNLLIIGDGPEFKNLYDKSIKIRLKGLCYFAGETHDENEIANYIYFSNLCVSPGNIGLTAIHSLSYGTPICSHNNLDNQMPEIEILKNFTNGIFFDENDVNSLSRSIESWFMDFDHKFSKKTIRFEVDKNYNHVAQSKIFKKTILS